MLAVPDVHPSTFLHRFMTFLVSKQRLYLYRLKITIFPESLA